MTRRSLFKSLAALPLVGLALPKPKTYGYVDCERWFSIPGWERRRVHLDGRDITHECQWFDDEKGEAGLVVTQRDDVMGDWPRRRTVKGHIEVRET